MQDGAGSKGRHHFNIKRALIPLQIDAGEAGRLDFSAEFRPLHAFITAAQLPGTDYKDRTRLSVALSLLR